MKWIYRLISASRTCAPNAINARGLDVDRVLEPEKQKMAYYPASMMPPSDHGDPVPLDRKAALAVKDFIETPSEALVRRAAELKNRISTFRRRLLVLQTIPASLCQTPICHQISEPVRQMFQPRYVPEPLQWS
ncbi:MAG: hypothetical protein JKY32_16700 [Rhizobiales bacterium]|nr:hypothetical protein [Hyphomicrobiales bacterium]